MRLATLSFDDGGWADQYVSDTLNELGVPGTFYLCSAFLDRFHYHDRFDNLREIYAGHEVGCHTHTHVNFIDAGLTDVAMRRETADSRKILQDTFEQPVENFAWPWGYATRPGIAALVDAGFKGARMVRPWEALRATFRPEYQVPISGCLPVQPADWARFERHPYVHLVGHGYEIRDRRRAQEIEQVVRRLQGLGYTFVTNAEAFAAAGIHQD